MDSIRFKKRSPQTDLGPRGEVVIEINGKDLIELVREVERPYAHDEGSPNIAGSYVGLSLHQLAGTPSEHFLGGANSHLYSGPKGKTVLLACGACGEPGCWPLMTRVETMNDEVAWCAFEQPHRKDWQYESVGPFRFDRRAYEAALEELVLR